MEKFETEFKKLNSRQQKAVDSIDGPVLVVAGPGTGKTQLLSMRVANILRKTDTDARSILCLTFTNKAATNMRERLLLLIGTDAHSVQVKTFHSFAADVMAQYPDYFWAGARLTTAPDAVLMSVIHDILSKLPLDNPLAMRYSGHFTAISDVQNGLKLIKEAGLTSQKLRGLINANTTYIDAIEDKVVDILASSLSMAKLDEIIDRVSTLPDDYPIDTITTPLISLKSVLVESLEFAVSQDRELGKTTRTGAWKRKWVQTVNGQKGMFDERRRNKWWLNLADVYDAYREELGRRGYYDYSDMLVQVISQLEQSADLHAQIQEQFLYVLIDEFQDTNAAQLRLAHLVAVQENDPRPNLMAVGDDDQSIFKFNGAELNNMLSFRRTYPATQLIVLTDNYRSNQKVLNASADIIVQANDRLVTREPEIHKDLQAVNPPPGEGLVNHQIYPTREHQYSMLAAEIARRHSTDPKQTVAVLARSHGSLKSIAASLLREKVPVSYEQQQNIIEHEAVRQILLLVDAVIATGKGDEPRLNVSISQMLRHPMWNIDAAEIWQLARTNFNQSKWLESLLASPNKNLETTGQWLIWLSQEASYQRLPVMIEYLIGIRPGEHMSSPVRDYYIQRQDSITSVYLGTLSAMHKLRGLVREYCVGNTEPKLTDFADFVELNRTNNRVITDTSWFNSSPDAVELLSVHKAKGLEFDTVYIIDVVENEWQPRKAGRKPPANLPLQPYGDDYDDYVRLMYVAMTRAKRNVIVTSFATDQNGEAVLPSSIVHKIPNAQLASISDENSIIALEDALRWPRLDGSDERMLLQDRLDNYQLSVTHLLGFLDVTNGGPKAYFERNLLRLPDIKSPKMAYGTAAHKAMETGQKLINNNKFNLDLVLKAYEDALKSEYLIQTEHERYLIHGQQTLRHLFEDLKYELPYGGLPEQSFKHIALGNARLSGSLDRIDTQDNKIIITDYKTGQQLSSFETRDKNKQVKAWKQRTQLIFYTLLLQNSPRYRRNSNMTGQMVYLEAENNKSLIRSYQATDEDLHQIEAIIQVVWKRIMDLSFPDTSHYSAGITGVQKFIDDLISMKI